MGKIKPLKPAQGKHIQVKENVKSTSTNHLHPAFNFKYLDSTYCLRDCTKDERAALSDKIVLLSQMTWGDIQNSNKHASGHEKIARDAIQGSIPGIITEDTNILAFRFDGKKPMVGFRKDKIFYVIWIDRNFTLYNHG